MPHKIYPEKLRYMRRHYQDTKEYRKFLVKRKAAEDKLRVLSHYGPNGKLQCSWPGCEVNDIDMLFIDHIDNGGGGADRPHGLGVHFYRYLRMNDFPSGFQTLCMNHQLKKEILRRRGA